MIGQDAVRLSEAGRLQRVFDLNLVDDYSLTIDGGACIGTWTLRMADHFKHVLAFEPCLESFEILCQNMADYPNVECRNQALMDVRGRVDSVMPRPKRDRLTSRMVVRKKRGAVRCIAIDDLALAECGLIKLDLEGAEGLALIGAAQTIAQCKPVLVVEMGGLGDHFGYSIATIHHIIKRHGYTEIFRDGVDRIYAPKGRQ
jgi:FkbM family methyltransferase